jgi:Short C-terminal domain
MDATPAVPDALGMSNRIVLRSLATYLGLAGVTVALVWLYESMRAVLAIGGSCASGGPYVVATPCPHGTGWTTVGAIFGGLAAAALYTAYGLRQGPRITILVWSALFLALGWNFLDFGLHDNGSGPASGWLVCAVVFALLGGGPVIALAWPNYRRDVLWSDGEGLPVGLRSNRPTRSASQPATLTRRPAAVRTGGWLPDDRHDRPAPERPADDVATALTKLSELHDRGALTDDEYANAKRRILED